MKRSLLYFFASFLNAGLQNVIPQVFFNEKYPHDQTFYISICLLFGAVSSLLTIFISQANLNYHTNKYSTWIQTLFILILLCSLWVWQTAVPYIITFLLLRGFIQALYNQMDHFYVKQTEKKSRGQFARAATLFQLIGIMAGPLYFSLFYSHKYINFIILFLLSFLLMWSFSSVFRISTNHVEKTKENPHTKSESAKKKDIKLKYQTTFFIIYLLTATTGVHIFSNNVIMIVRDSYQLSSAVVKSGVLLMLMNASGIITVAIFPLIKKRLSWKILRFEGYSILAILFLTCVVLLNWPLAYTYFYLIILSMLTGMVYGVFWMKTREFAINSLSSNGQKWILTLYNNANNFSILFSAIVLFFASLIATTWGDSYLHTISLSLMIFFGISACFAFFIDFSKWMATKNI